jgi:hypothetical protein
MHVCNLLNFLLSATEAFRKLKTELQGKRENQKFDENQKSTHQNYQIIDVESSASHCKSHRCLQTDALNLFPPDLI